MQPRLIHETPFDPEQTILCACMPNSNDVVMLFSTGQVARHRFGESNTEHLFYVKRPGQINLANPDLFLTVSGNVVSVHKLTIHV